MAVNSSQSETHNNFNYDIKFLCSLLTRPFDGNRYFVHEFISQCDTIFNLANEDQEYPMLAYVLSKITGSAKSNLRDQKAGSWRELKNLLITYYSDKTHFLILMENLNTIRQQSNETAITFFSRIDKCTMRIIDTIPDEDIAKIKTIREIALQRFIFHSLPDISRYLRGKTYKTINDALNDALEEEMALKINQQKLGNSHHRVGNYVRHNKVHNSNFHTQSDSNFQNRNQNPNNYNSQIRPNHSNSQARNYASTSNYHTSTATGNRSNCAYCKKTGHHISECRKRKYNNERRGNSVNYTQSQPLNEEGQGLGVDPTWPTN